MQKSTRQFNTVRSKNLQTTYSNIAKSTISKQPNLTHSFTSSFLNTSGKVCYNCVNKHIINEKKLKNEQQKQEDIEERKRIEARSNFQNPYQQSRQKAQKQAIQYNKQLRNRKLQAAKSEKGLLTAFVRQACQKEQQNIEEEKNRIKLQRQKELEYRQSLKQQLKEIEKAKEREKVQYRKEQSILLHRAEKDQHRNKMKYASDLKKQIEEDRQKMIQRKMEDAKISQKAIYQAEKEFQKYTEFSNVCKKQQNPEVFEELRLIQYTKKINKLDQRQALKRQRDEQQRKDKEYSDALRAKVGNTKKQYHRDLDRLVDEHIKSTAFEKQQERQFRQKEQRYTEDALKQSLRVQPCIQCKVEYEEKCFDSL